MKLPFKPKILADSYNELFDSRVTTFLIPFPTVKLAEFRVHRVISQHDETECELKEYLNFLSVNANSSRAIPSDKLKNSISNCSYIPTWTKNKSGMSGDFIDDEEEIEKLNEFWEEFKKHAFDTYEKMNNYKIHKQNLNLLFNPFSWSSLVVSADDRGWNHYFNLRCKEDVYPDVCFISTLMKELYENSNPKILKPGEWHIAFDDVLKDIDDLKNRLFVSISCCARISYDNNRNETLEKHIERAKKIILNNHLSTCEHQYMAPFKHDADCLQEIYWYDKSKNRYFYKKGKYLSNVKGWIQLRKLIESKEFSIDE